MCAEQSNTDVDCWKMRIEDEEEKKVYGKLDFRKFYVIIKILTSWETK